MRESKFRGLTEQGEWRYGDFITDTREFNRTCDRAYILPHWEKLNCPISVKPETVGQSTGLKDKNRKEIFEGDILKAIGIFGEVKYIPEHAGFLIHEEMGYTFVDAGNAPQTNYEVVGNIHENSELLEVTQ